jgi:hypothetical protein
MSIQRRGLDVQTRGQAAHRQLVEADLVEDVERRADDLLTVQRPALSAPLGRTERHDAHGSSGERHANTPG